MIMSAMTLEKWLQVAAALLSLVAAIVALYGGSRLAKPPPPEDGWEPGGVFRSAKGKSYDAIETLFVRSTWSSWAAGIALVAAAVGFASLLAATGI
jgi:hypothetical protein